MPGAVDPQDRGPGGFMDGMMGERGGEITVSAISESNVSLKTADGWTRTIAITSTTALTKGSATIKLVDLKVGDAIRFTQTLETDGTYTITKLDVVLPRTGGTVTGVTGSTITVTQRDGTTAMIKVTSSTTYEVGATTGKALTDVKVGMVVGAVGTLNADGSLTASALRAFDPATMPGQGHNGPDHDGHGPWGDGTPGGPPASSPAASAGTSAG